MRFNVEHALLCFFAAGAAVAEGTAHYLQAGGSLPSWLHVTAAGCLAAATSLGLLVKSIKADVQTNDPNANPYDVVDTKDGAK